MRVAAAVDSVTLMVEWNIEMEDVPAKGGDFFAHPIGKLVAALFACLASVPAAVGLAWEAPRGLAQTTFLYGCIDSQAGLAQFIYYAGVPLACLLGLLIGWLSFLSCRFRLGLAGFLLPVIWSGGGMLFFAIMGDRLASAYC
jgi:hypothetical protein